MLRKLFVARGSSNREPNPAEEFILSLQIAFSSLQASFCYIPYLAFINLKKDNNVKFCFDIIIFDCFSLILRFEFHLNRVQES